jgi:hypothetical protein
VNFSSISSIVFSFKTDVIFSFVETQLDCRNASVEFQNSIGFNTSASFVADTDMQSTSNSTNTVSNPGIPTMDSITSSKYKTVSYLHFPHMDSKLFPFMFNLTGCFQISLDNVSNGSHFGKFHRTYQTCGNIQQLKKTLQVRNQQ